MIKANSCCKFLVASTPFVLASCSAALAIQVCEQGKVKDQIRNWLLGIEDYRMVAEVSMQDVRAISKVSGKKPDRLRIEIKIQGSPKMVEKVIFDGTYQWVESTGRFGTRVLRIKAGELADPRTPFDTSYYLMGSGLLSGEDFPSTVATLLSVYDIEVSCLKGKIRLSGPINSEKFRKYCSAKKHTRSRIAAMRKFEQMFAYLKMEFDALNEYVLRRYSLVPSKERQSFLVEFMEPEINKGLPESLFTYSPPPGSQPEDFTEQLKETDPP